MNASRTLMMAAAMCCAATTAALAADPTPVGYLHVYGTDDSYQVFDNGTQVTFRGDATQGYHSMVLDGAKEMKMVNVKKMVHLQRIPELRITTEYDVNEPPDKVNYLNGTYDLKGFGTYEDATGPIQIRGRGNSTWSYAKKPYRLHFDSKTKMLGLKKAKNFVLLANYIDPALMRNAVSMEMARIAGTPYPNAMIPVNVWLNDRFKGSYMLTDKVGINGNSVDIDEATSVLWELDTNYDEDNRFHSAVYGLPVMVKDPDMDAATFAEWKDDFNAAEAEIAAGNLKDVVDIPSLVACMMVFNVTLNQELCHPKSFYMFKTKGEGQKYHFGPVWDFDWCYGYIDGNVETLSDPETTLLYYTGESGYQLTSKIMQNADFMTAFRAAWRDFYDNGGKDRLMAFFDQYARLSEPAAAVDSQKYSRTANHEYRVQQLRDWLTRRLEYINSHKNLGLY